VTSFTKVVEHRLRASPSVLVLYEHEIDKYLDQSLCGNRSMAEALVRAGVARHNGIPIRVVPSTR
jgi:hypothetical protein